MRIAHFNHFVNVADKPKSIEEQLRRGELIDVTAYAGKFLGARRVFIDSRVHERFVEWSSAAVRRHAVHREAQHRLASLLEASGCPRDRHGRPGKSVYTPHLPAEKRRVRGTPSLAHHDLINLPST